MNRLIRGLVAALLALGLAACANNPGAPESAPDTTATDGVESPAAASLKACMVGDASGFQDGSFNQTSHEGLLRAADELGVETAEIQSPSEAEYGASIQALIDADCELVVTIGFRHADATEAAALANPDVNFLLVDAQPSDPQPNVKPLLFDPTGAAFIAGYLAAAQSTSQQVATFGAVKNADVVLFLNGFAGGVAHYNQAKGAAVQLLGWDVERQDGQFITSQMPFQDTAAGKTTAQLLVDQGADVVFPVAGMAGTGALQVAEESDGRVAAIWVDTDGCRSNPGFCPVILTSVYKALDVAVFEAIEHTLNQGFDSTPYQGTLENQGVGISPLHEFADRVPPQIVDELDELRLGLIDGSIAPPAVG